MTTPSRRILLAGDGNFLAHISRLVEIGRALEAQGADEVVLAASGPYTRLATQAGFRVVPVSTAPGDFTLEVVRQMGLMPTKAIHDVIAPAMRDDVKVLEAERPDLVVCDMRWTMRSAAERVGVPLVSITNAFWTRYCPLPLPAPPGHALTKVAGHRIARQVATWMKPGLTRWAARPFRQARAEHGLDPAGALDLYHLVEGDLVLLADFPEFGHTTQLPDHYHYVGPILWSSSWEGWEPTPWLRDRDRSRPLVYVTMGSTGDPHVFREIAERFGHGPVDVVMTTAGMDFDATGLPPNVHTLDYGPGHLLMEEAAVVVNHGGNGTINQAILAGRPVVGVPTHLDQSINLAQVEALGFGHLIDPGRRLGARLTDAVHAVLADPSYRMAAERLQAAAQRYGGADEAARRILGLLESRSVA
ncbi:MAG: hypothetical protein H6732_15130 [Alphaproteobacteria bacterium]|nr:hypothetical protein [Alphaproteobacteria bacterium]